MELIAKCKSVLIKANLKRVLCDCKIWSLERSSTDKQILNEMKIAHVQVNKLFNKNFECQLIC